jgi:hypothetical protein
MVAWVRHLLRMQWEGWGTGVVACVMSSGWQTCSGVLCELPWHVSSTVRVPPTPAVSELKLPFAVELPAGGFVFVL